MYDLRDDSDSCLDVVLGVLPLLLLLLLCALFFVVVSEGLTAVPCRAVCVFSTSEGLACSRRCCVRRGCRGVPSRPGSDRMATVEITSRCLTGHRFPR